MCTLIDFLSNDDAQFSAINQTFKFSHGVISTHFCSVARTITCQRSNKISWYCVQREESWPSPCFLHQHIHLEVWIHCAAQTMEKKKTSQPAVEYSSISDLWLKKKYIFGVWEVNKQCETSHFWSDICLSNIYNSWGLLFFLFYPR